MSQECLLTRAQVAEITGLSMQTIDRHRKNDVYPFNQIIKIGRAIRYPSTFLNEIQKITKNDDHKKTPGEK
jgi:predicted DNA-binding transcriptional regulator AlpA